MSYALVFIIGSVIGSFLSVCIRRIPLQQSIVRPASHCPRCGSPIRPYDNVPLLSYAVLRGRCRSCNRPISVRYPLVESLGGVFALLLFWRFGLTPQLVVHAVLVAALVVITFIDIDHQLIPDAISLPGIPIGFASALAGYGPGWVSSLAGILLGGGFLYAVAAGYHAATGREGLGGGDIKLLAMIGAFLGWEAVLLTLLVGSLTGALVGIGLMLARGADSRMPMPFGPFLALGALCALFSGGQLLDWYLSLISVS